MKSKLVNNEAFRAVFKRRAEEMAAYRGYANPQPTTPEELRFEVAGRVFWNRFNLDGHSEFLRPSFYCQIVRLPENANDRSRDIKKRTYLAAEVIYESVLFDMRDCLPEGCQPDESAQEQAKAVSDMLCHRFVFEFLPQFENDFTANFTCAQVLDWIESATATLTAH